MDDWKVISKPALLILHMQHGIVGEGNKFYPDFAKVVKESNIIPRQQALLKVFRDKKLPVIYVNVKINRLNGSLPAYGFLWKVAGSAESTPRDLEVIPELTPEREELVLINWPFSAFCNSGLEQVLKVSGIETLIPVGFATNGVVLSAIQGAADRYYSVIVPSDASASPSTKAHEVVMEIMAPAFALVTTTQDVIAHL